MEALPFYSDTLAQLQQEQKKLLQRKSALGIFRFGTIAALVAAFYVLYSLGWPYVVGAAAVLLFIFTRLVYKDLANKAALAHVRQLISINEDEIKAMSGQYFHFKDGALLMPANHYYANDMDLFGHASLFQFANRCTSDTGERQLAAWLLQPATPEEITARQQAVKELSAAVAWRQKLAAYGKENPVTDTMRQRLLQWLSQPTVFRQFRHWQWLRYVLPGIILSISLLTWLDVVDMNLFYAALLLFAIIAFQINKFVAPIHEQLSKMAGELNGLSQSIATIEQGHFKDPLLAQLQQQFAQQQNSASQIIQQLRKMLDRLDIRYNIVLSAPLNLLLLWNLQQVLDLEKWKQQHAAVIDGWFATLGIFEALNSFATLHFNHPAWVFPAFKDKHFFIEAAALGHPLIPETKRVDNFINITQKGEVMLLTGSNMAGKSTYLRSVGVNVILAMAGAPVCAKSFVLSPVQLISSMRIADNLEESTSTFYAELKKLKTIIEKVNAGAKVFVLLDEILRGTNSFDRHTGSAALVKQLIKQQAAAIIATHDIALADLQKDYPANILNFHFDVQVNKEELYFDYKLKPGVCSSMNASILMKKIGIEL